jgi:hypothetical protein
MKSALDRARQALSHKDLAWIDRLIPRQYADNPVVIRKLLATAALGLPSLNDNPRFTECVAALGEIERAQSLQNQIAAVYHDPRLRAEVGSARLEEAWRHPEAAYAELVARSAKGRLPPHLDAALDVLGSARQWGAENNIPMTGHAPAAAVPAGEGLDREYDALIAKSAKGRLTTAEDQRLDQLAEARATRENAAPSQQRQPDGPRPPTEYDRLIRKPESSLTSAERSRLDELAGHRAVEEGRISVEDLAAERGDSIGRTDE